MPRYSLTETHVVWRVSERRRMCHRQCLSATIGTSFFGEVLVDRASTPFTILIFLANPLLFLFQVHCGELVEE